MRVRWIVTLAALYFVVLFCGGIFIGLFIFGSEQTRNQNQYSSNWWSKSDDTFSIKYIPVIHNDQQFYFGENKPHVVTTSLIANDYRSDTSFSLNIKGWVNNTGGGTAYNGMLHIVAMNSEGVAIDTERSFTGITAYRGVGFSLSLPYSGSALINCTITPLYLDGVDMQIQGSTRNGTYSP